MITVRRIRYTAWIVVILLALFLVRLEPYFWQVVVFAFALGALQWVLGQVERWRDRRRLRH